MKLKYEIFRGTIVLLSAAKVIGNAWSLFTDFYRIQSANFIFLGVTAAILLNAIAIYFLYVRPRFAFIALLIAVFTHIICWSLNAFIQHYKSFQPFTDFLGEGFTFSVGSNIFRAVLAFIFWWLCVKDGAIKDVNHTIYPK